MLDIFICVRTSNSIWWSISQLEQGDRKKKPGLKTKLTRPEVAAILEPEVTTRQLQDYLNVARKHIPSFKKFTSITGELNRRAKLDGSHIPILQEIRTLARDYSLDEIDSMLQLKKEAVKHLLVTDNLSN